MIALCNMPFASIFHPSLALGLFQAQLVNAGAAARTYNFNFDFARQINFGSYEIIAMFKGVETQVGEWLFAEHAWRRPVGLDDEAFLSLCGEELATIPKVADPKSWLLRIKRGLVGPFLEQCYRRLFAEGAPEVVAFSCMFFQTVPALALGRLIKERHPEIRLAYGGACFHGEMGEELFQKVPWIDAVSTGEADDVIVPLLRALAERRTPSGLHGILARDPLGLTVKGPPVVPVSPAVLDALPDPDYSDFIADASRYGLPSAPAWQDRFTLPFEGSRGCWWGQKRHCTFCGLNAEGMTHRAKSAARVESTMRRLAERYSPRHLQAADNILTIDHQKTLLPRLAERPLPEAHGKPVEAFFEIKANMTRAQVKELARAGVSYVQPGIESLSTHILELMGKGVTALQNVFLLKTCTEYGVVVYWNLLIRVPGERREDYEQIAGWLPRLVHLRPPSGGAPKIELHRFSPYHFRRGEWTEGVRPAAWYKGLFPEDEIDLARVAYYFDCTWKDTLGDPAYDAVVKGVLEWMRLWRDRAEAPRLTMRDTAEGGLLIEDTRGGAAETHRLDPLSAAIYRLIADPASIGRVIEELPGRLAPGHDRTGPDEVAGRLRRLVEDGLALTERGRFLGLALPPEASAGDPARRRVQMRRVANQAPRQEA